MCPELAPLQEGWGAKHLKLKRFFVYLHSENYANGIDNKRDTSE
jgi:hypothetical protein